MKGPQPNDNDEALTIANLKGPRRPIERKYPNILTKIFRDIRRKYGRTNTVVRLG